MHSILRSTPIRAGLAVGAAVLLAVATFAASRSWAATLLVLVGLILVFAFVTLTTMRLGNTVSRTSQNLADIGKATLKESSRATFHAKEASERSNELKREMRALPGAAPSDVGRGVQASDSLEGIVLDGVIRRAGKLADRLEDAAVALEEPRGTTLPKGAERGRMLKATNGTKVSPSERELLEQFPPLEPWFTTPRREDITAAVILDDFSHLAFAHEWNTVRLDIDNWLEQVTHKAPDLLFVESAWHGNGDDWALKVAGRKGPSRELEDLVTWFRLQGIPTVFWNKEDPEHFADFIAAAKLFDHVFTTDEKCLPKYREKLGHDRVHTLPFAAQTAIHNPAKIDGITRSHDVAFGGTYFHHKFKSRRDQMDIVLHGALDAMEKTGGRLEVFSRFQEDERYRFPESISESVVGSLPYPNMLTAYKSFKVFLNVNTVTKSKTMCARRIFELIASGTPVVSTPSTAIGEFFEPGELAVAKDRKQAENHVRSLVQSPELVDRAVHRGQRRIWSAHTYSHRAETVLRKVAPDKTRSLARKPVSVLAPTNRPEHVENIFANFSRQAFSSKQLVLITHGFEVEPRRLTQLKDEYAVENLRIIPAEAELTLGACLNRGIARAEGSTIAKMDDDDYYAPEYLGDMSHALAYSRADVVGKRAHYMYLEDRSTLIVRLPDQDHRYVDFVIGPTIVAAKSLLTEIPFEDRTRGEDSSLMRNVTAAGGRIYATDRFNFCQYRGAHDHTWNVHPEALLAMSTVVGFGDPRQTVTV
ncbi:MAG: glycosyltransferase family protein [Microbacterium sp.]